MLLARALFTARTQAGMMDSAIGLHRGLLLLMKALSMSITNSADFVVFFFIYDHSFPINFFGTSIAKAPAAGKKINGSPGKNQPTYI
jgi:hypothetical protein